MPPWFSTKSSGGKHRREKGPSSWAEPSFQVRTARAACRSEIYEARGLHVTNVPCPEVPPWAQLCTGTEQGSM